MSRKTTTLLSLGISAVLIAAAIWFLYTHNFNGWMGRGPWGMGPHHMMGGGMGLVMILFWIVLIGAVVLLISGAVSGVRDSRSTDREDSTGSLEILNQRYTRGEIDRAEYEEKRRDLTN